MPTRESQVNFKIASVVVGTLNVYYSCFVLVNVAFDSRIGGYSGDFLSHYVSTRLYNMSGMSKNDTAMLQEILMEISKPSPTFSRIVGFISVFLSIIFSMVVFLTASDDKEKTKRICVAYCHICHFICS